MNVMIELYKRKIWNDDKTVNAISEGCLNPNPKIVVAACKFFITLQLDYESESEGESDDSDLQDKIEALKGHKGSKLTKGKKQHLEKLVK
jgi:protein SDA1